MRLDTELANFYPYSERMPALWVDLWKECGAVGDAEIAYRNLYALYTEPQRFYHNITHIRDCLIQLHKHLEELQDDSCNRIELAIWFHDAIYDTKRNDNEEKSADFACEAIRAIKNSDLELTVRELILDTKHKKMPRTIDGQILCDIDLSILGQNENVFDQYDANIRKEYAWVPEAEYRAGRTKVLQSFLDRPTIFWTEHFRKEYETQARINLARTIERLR
jgi:predicted metal-dependent HD superfamily phosphohydrolase